MPDVPSFWVSGSAPAGAPTVVLCGGLAAPPEVWAPQIGYFGDRLRFIGLRYRGLVRGEGVPRRADLGIGGLVSDLGQVVEAAGVGACSVIGWGAGVQVALEGYYSLRERVQSLVLIAGTAGRAFSHLPLAGAAGRLAALAQLLCARTLHEPAQRRRLFALAGRLDSLLSGAPGAGSGEPAIARIAAHVAEIDGEAYRAMLAALMRHDASSLLAGIAAPALVIGGDRDPLTPVARLAELARKLPRSQLCIVRGAGHLVAIDHADLVNLRIEDFFRDAGVL